MARETQISTFAELPESVRTYLLDATGDDEAFQCGVAAEGGLLRSGPAVVLTSVGIYVVQSGLVDTRGRFIAPEDVEAFRFEQSDALVRFAVILERTTVEATLRDFPDQFADRLAESFGGTPVRIDLPDHRSERRTDPREPAERAVEAADDALTDGDVETAIAELETAIGLYDRIPDDEATDAIDSTRARIETLQRIDAVRSELRDELTEAEQSFRTAVAAHANGKRTLARIRYRQARDGYAESTVKITNAPDGVLTGGLDVSAGFDGDPPPERLSALRLSGAPSATDPADEAIPDHRSRIRDASVDELAAIHRDASLRDELGGLLLLLAAWEGEELQRFRDRSAVELRNRLAAVGFSVCR